MNRGDRRGPICKDDADRARFLETLGQCCTKSDWQVLAWCLMNNHVGVATAPQRRSEEGEDRAKIEGESDHDLEVDSLGVVHRGLDACIELVIAGPPWEEVTAI